MESPVNNQHYYTASLIFTHTFVILFIYYIMSTSSLQLHDLDFQWFAARINDISSCRGIVHESSMHCFRQFINKLVATGRISVKYYVFFHVIPLAMRLRKCKNLEQVLKVIGNTGLDYLKSILFLSFLVGLQRGCLCLFFQQSQQYVPSSTKIITVSGLVSSVSILFEESSRRRQIVYFVCAKAMRSMYLILKRTMNLPLKWQTEVMHCLVMACIYFIYNHRPQQLKFRNIFQLIFGNS